MCACREKGRNPRARCACRGKVGVAVSWRWLKNLFLEPEDGAVAGVEVAVGGAAGNIYYGTVGINLCDILGEGDGVVESFQMRAVYQHRIAVSAVFQERYQRAVTLGIQLFERLRHRLGERGDSGGNLAAGMIYFLHLAADPDAGAGLDLFVHLLDKVIDGGLGAVFCNGGIVEVPGAGGGAPVGEILQALGAVGQVGV